MKIPILVLFFLVELTNLFGQGDTLSRSYSGIGHQGIYYNTGGFDAGLILDSLFTNKVAEGFNGVVLFEWKGCNDTSKYVDQINIIDRTVCNCENGFPVDCNQIVYSYRIGMDETTKWVAKSAKHSKGKPSVEINYYESGSISSEQIITVEGKNEKRDFISYNEFSDTIVIGSYLNGKMHGEWYNYDYNFSERTSFIEVWDEGKLIDVKNTDVLYISEEGELISKNKFFKIISDFPQWCIIGLNPAQNAMTKGHKFAMIIYSPEYCSQDQTNLNRILQSLGSN